MVDKVLYVTVRGIWRVSKEKIKSGGTKSDCISESTLKKFIVLCNYDF